MRTSETPVRQVLLNLTEEIDRLQVMVAEWQHDPAPLLALRRIRSQTDEVAKRANDAVMIASSGNRH